MSLDSTAKRAGHLSPLLQPSYLHPQYKDSIQALPTETPALVSNRNIVSWMFPYHSLDRAVLLHQASVRSRARHDLLKLQFLAKRSANLSQSLPSLPKGDIRRGEKEKRRRLNREEVPRETVSPNSLKYFNSAVIPDMRRHPVSLSEVNAYVAYLERKPFK